MPDQHELHRDPGLSEHMVHIELSLLLQIQRRKVSILKEKISDPRENVRYRNGERLEITIENEDGFKIILVLPVRCKLVVLWISLNFNEASQKKNFKHWCLVTKMLLKSSNVYLFALHHQCSSKHPEGTISVIVFVPSQKLVLSLWVRGISDEYLQFHFPEPQRPDI